MSNTLQMIFERLLNEVPLVNFRYLYDEFQFDNRLIGLVGPRGVGKTTLMLQLIKTKLIPQEKVFYFSADHIFFNSKSLYEYIEEVYLSEHTKIFFIDEIHRYKNWNQELKNLYDGFPSIKIIFSGSSSLDLVKGAYDLSRRAKMYHLPGLSFREYMHFKHDISLPHQSFIELMRDYQKLSTELSVFPGLIKYFHDYLQFGYYPFAMEDELSYHEKILRVVEKTIFEDITNFYNLKTSNLIHFSKILNYLATIPPGKISTYNLGKNLKIDDKTAAYYLKILSETGLVEIIYCAESGNQSLRKPEKVFLNNTNLHYAISSQLNSEIDIGTIRELAFTQMTSDAGLNVFHTKQADFCIDEFIFEIGGKNKTRAQIKEVKNAFLVKDDIVSAQKNCIPLCYFGLLF